MSEKDPTLEWVSPVPAHAPQLDFKHHRYADDERVDIYPCLDEREQVLYYTVRFQKRGQKKEVLPYHLAHDHRTDELRWIWSKPAENLPCFGLNELAARPDAPVMIVEGEKLLQAVRDLYPDYVPVTWPGGCNAVSKCNFDAIQERDVVLIPDNDSGGQAAMDKLSKRLAKCNRVKIIALPSGLPKGWDIADEFPQWLPPEDLLLNQIAVMPRLHGYGVAELKLHAKPMRPMLENLLAERQLMMVYAQRGGGKTWYGLALATALATGTDFLKYANKSGPKSVLYIDGEMAAIALHERLGKMGVTDIPNLKFVCADLEDESFVDIGNPDNQDELFEISKPYDVIILDNLSCLHRSGKENDGDDWMAVLPWLLRLKRAGKSVILIHHAGKNGSQRGTSRKEDALDVVIALESAVGNGDPKTTTCNMIFSKARHIHGDAMQDLSITLEPDMDGNLAWSYKPLEQATLVRVAELLKLGMEQKDIADELGISKGWVSKLAREARAKGLLVEEPGLNSISPTNI